MPMLYDLLADWWPLLSRPADYQEEAEFIQAQLESAAQIPVRRVVEFGSGGGNNASFLKCHFELTLIDLSPGMLEVSRKLNPEINHLQGDMRAIRLGQQFEAVLIHDAIMYMHTVEDLRKVFDTAFIHCRPGGAALFMPDYVLETFEPHTRHGGHDGDSRSLRYLEWTYDPDPTDTVYFSDDAYLLREVDGSVQVFHDRHVLGLFPRQKWLQLLQEAGFEPEIVIDTYRRENFLCKKLAA